MTGIAVSFVIMLLAIAIVSGFKNEIVNKLLGFNSQISILPTVPNEEAGKVKPLRLTDTLANEIRSVIPSAEITIAVNQPAVFKTDSAFQGILLRGLGREGNWAFISDNLTDGKLPDFNSDDNQQVVVSSTTAKKLGLKTGNKILTHFFDGNSLRTRNLKITGIYDSHFKDFDDHIAFTPIGMLQNLFRIDSISCTGIEINGVEPRQVVEASGELYRHLLESSLEAGRLNNTTPQIYHVESINQRCATHINWLELLNTNVVVIIVLMAFVSGFTLISSLFIIILERINMIGLFKALGATNTQIRRIFIYLAQRLVIRGLVIGNIIGVGIILLQSRFHILPLDPDAYYLNFVPMEFSWVSLLVLNLCVIVISAAILILPSHLISTLSPTKSMKFE